jgi:uridine kinase
MTNWANCESEWLRCRFNAILPRRIAMQMEKRKQQLLSELAHRLVMTLPHRMARVAIDGVDGAGKTTFADEVGSLVAAEGRSVIRASVDGFHNPKAVRYQRGRHSPEGFFEDSYNYSALKRYLLDPLSPGGSRRYRRAFFDHVSDDIVPADDLEALPSSILLIDGIFLHRRELLGYWDASVFLRTDFAVSNARCASRDGSSPDPAAPSNRRYVEGQRLYLRTCQPEAKATIVIDYNDLSSPSIVT